MLILDATTKSLQLKLSGAITTNQLPFFASYIDATSSATTPGEQDGASNNTTGVNVVSAPASSTQRLIKNIGIRNADTVAATLTVIYNNNATLRNILVVTLAVGDQLIYEDGHGWSTIDASGNIKTTNTGGVGSGISFSAYNSSVTTCAAATLTKIAFQTKQWDQGNYFDNTTNYRYTPLVAGTYHVTGMVSISSTNVVTTNQYNAVLYKNGTAYRFGSFNASIPNNATSTVSTLVQLNGSTDYIEMWFFNGNASTTLTTNNDSSVTYFQAVWLGP